MLRFYKKHKIIFSVVLSALFLYLAFIKISWTELETVLSTTSFKLIIFVVLINLMARFAIVYRWYLLLDYQKNMSIQDVFHFMNIGYFVNSVLPARSGDFVKAVMLARKRKIGKTGVIGSVSLERLFDMLGLSIAFLVALFVLDLPGYIKTGGFTILFISLVALIILALMSGKSALFYKNLSAISANRIYLWILRKIEQVFEYSQILNHRKLLTGLVITTLISWFLYVYVGYIILETISPGPFSWQIALLSLIIVSVSFVIPTTPGNLGVYQFACVLAFSIADTPKEPAIAFSLISQLPVYFTSIILGIYSMWHEGLTQKEINRLSIESEK